MQAPVELTWILQVLIESLQDVDDFFFVAFEIFLVQGYWFDGSVLP